MKCKIKVTEEIAGLYQSCTPKVGKIYDAEYIAPYNTGTKCFRAICFINVAGKRIMLRENEFEIVGGTNEK